MAPRSNRLRHLWHGLIADLALAYNPNILYVATERRTPATTSYGDGLTRAPTLEEIHEMASRMAKHSAASSCIRATEASCGS